MRRRRLRWWRRSVRIAISAVRVLVARLTGPIVVRTSVAISISVSVFVVRVCVWPGTICVCVTIAGSRVCVRICVAVRVPISFWLVLVQIAGRRRTRITVFICVIGVLVVVMADRFGRFALFRRATDVNGHSLARLYDFAGARQLKDDAIRLDLIAGADCAYAEIQAGAGQLILSDKSIFADDVRYFYF